MNNQMNRSHLIGALCAGALGLVSLSSHAALVSALGGQAVYDDDRNITWVANADLAASNTFGLTTDVSLGMHPDDAFGGNNGIINSNGTMNWPGALFWIDAMNAANYLGFNDWRLPTTLDPDSSCNNQDGTPSASPQGFDCTGSEMGHLFYDEFGADRETSVLSTGDPTELAKFSNISSTTSGYWSGTVFNDIVAWGFNFDDGFQPLFGKGSTLAVWAVRDGNVSAVPVPAALWLFGSGLIGMVAVGRRRRV